ncbi:MAG: translocation/assembly module TamB domain-containing protein [Cyclonatronaceae bacterium]
MSESEQHKRRRIWPWVTLAVLLVLLGSMRLALRSGMLLDYLRTQVETRTSEMINGELRIERMSGDLWSHLIVENIRIRADNPSEAPSPVMSMDSLYISWSVPDLIFRRPLEIRKLHALGIRASLVQAEDGSWNVLELLPPELFESDEKPDEEPSGFRFVLSDVRMTAPEISIDAHASLPGEPLSIRDLEAKLRLGMDEPGFFADLQQLELSLHESRLDAPVTVQTGAAWDGQRITLDRLLVASAYSLFEASGSYNTVTTGARLDALLDPLSWREAAAYAEAYPLQQDLDVEIRVSGSRQDLRTGLTLQAAGLERLSIDTRWSNLQEPVLTELTVQSGPVDAATLTGDDTMQASVGGFSLSMEGTVPLMEWDRVNITGNFFLEDARFDTYSVDAVQLGMAASTGILQADLTVRKGSESIDLEAEAYRWWEEDLDWTVSWQMKDLDPGYWTGLDELAGLLTMEGRVGGRGRAPEAVETPWTAEVNVERLKLAGYPEISAGMIAELTGERLQFESPVQFDGSEMEISADLLWARQEPTFEAGIRFRQLNASLLPGLEMLVTDINGSADVSGEGFDPETMLLDATLRITDSHVNRQPIEEVAMDLRLRDGIVYVDEGRLHSALATANLTLRQNISDVYDLRNRMDFELELLDLKGFADLAGAEILEVQGSFRGSLQADTRGQLVLQSDLDLHGLRYDTIRVEELTGSATANLGDKIEYQADLSVRGPSVGPYGIRDITFATNGDVADEVVDGEYVFEFNVESESSIRQEARYHVSRDTVQLHTYGLRLTDPAGTYQLDRPFDVTLAGGMVRVDTLRLVNTSGSELSLYLDKAEGTPWTGFIDASGTDLGQVQHIFLDEPLFGAVLTGRIGFRVDEHEMEVDARTALEDVRWDTVELDSLHLAFDLADGRMRTDAAIWHDGLELVRSELDLPFEPVDPGTLDEAFFERPLSGYIRVLPFDISLFQEILNRFGLERTSGEFSISTELSGTAGAPEFDGRLYLKEGALSGVNLDSLVMIWDYDHTKSNLELDSRIHSVGQKALDITGRVPLYLDIPALAFEGPDPDDAIAFSVNTSDFNLAAVNDFLDPALLRNLQGRLDAEIEVEGTMTAPALDGRLALSGGQVRLVENNITLQRMQMNVAMTPGRIILEELSARSAGSFSGQGEITLEGLMPDRLDLRFRATNFRVFNTDDMDVFAGMDISMTGTMDEPFLDGDILWERGTIFLDDFGDREVEEVVLDEEPAPEPEGPEFFDRLALELEFSVDRNAFVRNRGDPEINLALRGEIDILKEAFEEVQLFGDMGVTSGHVTTFNKRFQLERGNVTFSGDPMDPMLDIRTLYEPRQQYEDIRIYYIIGGTLSDPEFEYESEPEMELQDIISYTLFGRPFHALAGWEQTMSGRSDGSMATNLAMDIMLDRIETLAADRLGIDVIEIENSRRGSGGTSIKAGKFVSDRLFIAFLQELGGTEDGRQVMVEYLLGRNLELIITAGDEYRSGVDVMWRYDY